MQQKNSPATIIIGVSTLIVLGFILFSTIYDQIIAQNEGFFYMLIFGGILVLVFVLMNLITKLLAISTQASASVGLTILEISVILGISCLFIFQRLSYQTSLPVEDNLFYRAASFITDGTVSGSLDVVTKLLRNPNDYAYAFVLSIFFRFTSVIPEAVIYVNIFLLIIIALFASQICRKIGGRVCGVIAFAATLFVPSQAYGVYTFNSVLFYTASFLIPFCLYVNLVLTENIHTAIKVINCILLAFFTGLLLITEPLAILFVLLMVLHYMLYSRRDLKTFFITLGGIFAVYLIFVIVKGVYLGVPVSEVFRYTGLRFRAGYNEDTGETYEFSQIFGRLLEQINNQNSNISDNYYFLTKTDGSVISAIQSSWLQLATSLIYMFSLVLSISCEIFMFRIRNTRGIPVMLIMTGTVFVAFLKSVNDANGFFVFQILLMLGGVGLAYMYQNQHPEDFIEEDIVSAMQAGTEEAEADEIVELTLEEQEEQLRRARALIFIGEDEDLYEQIKREEAREKAEKASKPEENKEKSVQKLKKEPDTEQAEDEPQKKGFLRDSEEEDDGGFYDAGEDEEEPEDDGFYDDPEDEEETEDDGYYDDPEYEAEAEDDGYYDDPEYEAEAEDDGYYDDPAEDGYDDFSDRKEPEPLDKKTLRRLEKERKKAEKLAKKEARRAARSGKNVSVKRDIYKDEDDLMDEDPKEDPEFDDGNPGRGKPLRNPLPQPRKRERKPMDYDDDFADEPDMDEPYEDPDETEDIEDGMEDDLDDGFGEDPDEDMENDEDLF